MIKQYLRGKVGCAQLITILYGRMGRVFRVPNSYFVICGLSPIEDRCELKKAVGKDEDEVVRHLRQRLGVLIAGDNAAMIASRHPTFAPPEVDGDPD